MSVRISSLIEWIHCPVCGNKTRHLLSERIDSVFIQIMEEIVIMKKNLAVFFVLLICSTFIFACGKADTESMEDIKDTKAENDTKVGNDTEAGNDTEVESNVEYWLCGTGIPDGPDYTGGICEVYFKQNAVVLEGNLLKSMSQEDYGQQTGTVET